MSEGEYGRGYAKMERAEKKMKMKQMERMINSAVRKAMRSKKKGKK